MKGKATASGASDGSIGSYSRQPGSLLRLRTVNMISQSGFMTPTTRLQAGDRYQQQDFCRWIGRRRRRSGRRRLAWARQLDDLNPDSSLCSAD
jgi:hypothetical protein